MDSILKEYDNKRQALTDFVACLENLVQTLVREAGITPQSISARVKSRESLTEKLKRPEKSYSSLDHITDICGIRVITYFKEDVDKVAQLLEAEMTVDSENSIDKRIYESPDRFGYQSLHYVVTLNERRCALREYKKYAGIKAEIQVRTVIQHAWAEIEHDLGYKSEIAVPLAIKRRFHRLAAIFELSDEEFSQVRSSLSDYVRRLSIEIKTTPEFIALDGNSIDAFVRENKRLESVEVRVAQITQCTRSPANREFSQRFVAYLDWLGIKTIDDLNKAFAGHEELVVKLMTSRVKGFDSKKFTTGLGLIYLCYAIMARRGDLDYFVEFFNHFSFGSVDVSHEEFASELIQEARK